MRSQKSMKSLLDFCSKIILYVESLRSLVSFDATICLSSDPYFCYRFKDKEVSLNRGRMQDQKLRFSKSQLNPYNYKTVLFEESNLYVTFKPKPSIKSGSFHADTLYSLT